jgi:t-SNARE complex subunit (syntaxin)
MVHENENTVNDSWYEILDEVYEEMIAEYRETLDDFLAGTGRM